MSKVTPKQKQSRISIITDALVYCQAAIVRPDVRVEYLAAYGIEPEQGLFNLLNALRAANEG